MNKRDDRSLVKANGIEEVELDGEVVLFRDGHLHRLNATGAFVWRCVEGSTIREVIDRTAVHFDEPPSVVEAPVGLLCDQLRRHGLLTAEGEAGFPSSPRSAAPAGAYVGPGEPPSLTVPPRFAYRSGRFVAMEHDFAVHTTSVAAGEALSLAFGGLAAAGPAAHVYGLIELADGMWGVTLDHQGLNTARDLQAGIRHVVWHVNSEAIRRSGDQLIVHGAGAVIDGRTVILPGEMNAGKTTLVAGLLLAGHPYLTDELLAFDARGRVHPYPRPMNVGRGSWQALAAIRPWVSEVLEDQWLVNPLAVPGAVLGEPAVPDVLIAPRYRAGASEAVAPMSKVDALELLHAQVLNPRPLDAESFHRLVATVRAIRAWHLTTSSLSGGVALVQTVVENGDEGH